MRWTLDKTVGAAYLRFTDQKPTRQEVVGEGLVADLADGDLVGLEMIGPVDVKVLTEVLVEHGRSAGERIVAQEVWRQMSPRRASVLTEQPRGPALVLA